MLKTLIPTLAFALTIGAAQTQIAHAQSARAAHAGGSPGTVGAMETAAYGIATSVQDVVLQQQGRATAAQGAQPVAPGAHVSGYSAGTVGAGLSNP